ncbi:hypothetical protein Poli38472_008373 [Pythium oligandrum]|uniref:Mitofilin n=1 Tax=Pythium oligandrum TaxID=41045 RepID=A0A8K1FK73_PYTOL|nr:hypothetical protein Poli38472_008373 [Pythium oligandrum]|eukprot:TMW65731.1 hypothetical protein Poli38472_008373 [Pythium oligandrum]
MMLRANRVVSRRLPTAGARRLSTRNDAGLSKTPVPPPLKQSPIPGAAPTPVKPTPLPVAEKSGGFGLGSLLLLTALSAPAGAVVYLKQNPSWNPEVVKNDPNWIKFRELVLGDAIKSFVNKQVEKVKPREPSKTPEELSAYISKANPAADLPKPKPAPVKVEKVVKEPVKKEEKKVEVVKAKKAEPKAEKKTEVKPVVAAKAAAPVEKKPAETKVAKAAASAAATATTTAAVVAPVVEKKVDEAVSKERKELDKLAGEATPATLGAKVDKQIQSTTKEIVDTLQAEATAAAVDVDKNYLNGIHELDVNALAIRVAQLATEMKHRSKWEAVRLLEALRRMEEDTKKKSTEVLERQQSLHKELLERELRLQEEVLTRKTRDEMDALKKQYKEDLARNVQTEKTTILNELKEQFAKDKKAIEDRFAAQLRTKSEELQATLTKERSQRLTELEQYRAQLRALNDVLERTSTYEAFSHQVHKASMAALALSDRIEAAAPLRTEIKALREFARNDPFIDAALKTLPSQVVEEGAASVSQLQDRFKTVATVGRRAAMIPEDSGLVGQLFGGALSYLIIPPGGPIEGDDADAIYSRADYALKAGDIEGAVTELKALKGLPAEVTQDWLSAAEDRLAVEQTAKVVKAHISLLAASCS